MKTLRTYDLDLIARKMAGALSAEETEQLARDAAATFIRHHNAAVRRSSRIAKEIAKLRREMVEHCRNPHGHGRRAEIINFDLVVLLAERDRLSHAMPTMNDELLEQLADDYDAVDARAAAKADTPKHDETAREDFHIKLPVDADPAAVVEAAAPALGGKESE